MLTEREMFEKWITSAASPIPAGVHWDSPAVTEAWATWQARAALAAPAQEPQWEDLSTGGWEQAVASPIAAQWLPIETAPKDATDLLLWNGVAVTGYWSKSYGGYWRLVEAGSHAEDNSVDEPITHWMPLPAPPKGEKD